MLRDKEAFIDAIVEDQNMPPQNMPPCHKDYFELIILRNRRYRRSSETKVEVTLLQGVYIYKGNLHL